MRIKANITDFDSALGPPEPVAEGDDSALFDRDPHRQPHHLQVPHAPHVGFHHGGLALAILVLVPCSLELGCMEIRNLLHFDGASRGRELVEGTKALRVDIATRGSWRY